MMKVLTGLALCCAALFAVVTARPGGAPASACDSLRPGANSPHGANEQQGANPWMIDLSDFPAANGSYYYNPGTTYNVTLRRTSGTATVETLLGFFIQGRTTMTNSMVGVFADPSTDNPNTRLSSCTPRNTVGVTHNNAGASLLSGPFTFEWTAPAAGTGPIWFRYTIVQTVPVWWADDPSAAVQEVNSEGPTGGAPQLQGVGQWTLLVVAAFTIALKTMLW